LCLKGSLTGSSLWTGPWSWTSPWWGLWWTKCHWTWFSLSAWVFPVSVFPPALHTHLLSEGQAGEDWENVLADMEDH